MSETDTRPTTGERAPWPPEEFIARLRAQGTRYHNLHPFHRRMDAGELTREELQRWVANRFYYQKCIPLKDAAILSNCPEIEVRREWIGRIIASDPDAAIVMITAHSAVSVAVEAIKRGASDFVAKPCVNERLAATVASAGPRDRSPTSRSSAGGCG